MNNKKIIVLVFIFVIFILGVLLFEKLNLREKIQNFANNRNSSSTVTTSITEAQSVNFATLFITMGTVETSLNETDWVTAINGEKYYEGTFIRTAQNSRAMIIYPDNSITRMDENTQILLESISVTASDSNITIQQQIGNTWNKVIEFLNPNTSEFSVETSDSVAMVRGTTFNVEVIQDSEGKIKSRFYTIKSKIEIRNKLNEISFELPEGEQGEFDQDFKLTKIKITDDFKEREWFKFAVQHDEDIENFFIDKNPRERFYLNNNLDKIDFRIFNFKLQISEPTDQIEIVDPNIKLDYDFKQQ